MTGDRRDESVREPVRLRSAKVDALLGWSHDDSAVHVKLNALVQVALKGFMHGAVR